MSQKTPNIIIDTSPAIPFAAITNWAIEQNKEANGWYNWIPVYTDKKTQKQYEKWKKENGKN